MAARSVFEDVNMRMTIEVGDSGVMAAYFEIHDNICGKTVDRGTCMIDYDMSGEIIIGVEILGAPRIARFRNDMITGGISPNIAELVIQSLPSSWVKHGKV